MAKGQRPVGYVPAYSDLTRHDKTREMAEHLRIKSHGPQAVAGYLVTLWNRCAQENVPTPAGGPLAEDRIEFWAEWTGRRGAFLEAAISAGYIERHEDGRLYLHDWEHGGGRIVASRERWRRSKAPGDDDNREEFRAEHREKSARTPARQIRSDLSSPSENDPDRARARVSEPDADVPDVEAPVDWDALEQQAKASGAERFRFRRGESA